VRGAFGRFAYPVVHPSPIADAGVAQRSEAVESGLIAQRWRRGRGIRRIVGAGLRARRERNRQAAYRTHPHDWTHCISLGHGCTSQKRAA
jgi:hypothetical protein